MTTTDQQEPPVVQPDLDLIADAGSSAVAVPLKPPRQAALAPGLAALGLSRDPFDPAGEPFFPGADRQKHLSYLQQPELWAHALLVVTGRSGSGRSTMYRTLSAALPGSVKAARVTPPLRTGEQLVQRICHGLALPVSDDAGLDDLRAFIIDHGRRLAEADRSAVVMVDDGQELGADALQQLLLLAAAAQQDGGLHLVVFAHPRFVGALAKAREKLAIDLTWHQMVLNALTLNETRNYLKLRFAAAGHSGRNLFTEADLLAVHVASEGLPGRINRAARNRLLGDQGDDAGTTPWLPVRHAVLAALVLLVLLPAVWWLWPPPEDAAARPAPDAAGLPGTAAARKPASPRDATDKAPAMPAPTPVADAGAPVPASGVAPAALPAEPARQSPAVDAPATAATRAPATTPASASATTKAAGWDWLLAQPAGHWSLQLLGLGKLDRAQAFVASQAEPWRFHVLATDRAGSPWYLVLHGSFADRDQAEQALAELPDSAVPELPWTRSMSALQALTPAG